VNNRERFLAALKLKVPDRVPCFDFFDKVSIINTAKVLFGGDIPEIKSEKGLVDHTLKEEDYKYHALQLELIEKMDLDAVGAWSLKDYRHIPDKGEDLVEDGYGIIWRLTRHGEPVSVEGPVKDEGDLARIEGIKPSHKDFCLLEYFKEKAPEKVLVYGLVDPFRLSWSLLGGIDKLLPLYVMKPDFSLRLTRIATDLVKQELELAIDKGAEVVILEGDLAFKANTFMSRDHYREFIQPFHREICDAAHQRGVPVIKHSDGNIWLIIDDLVETGFDGLHPIEPQCMDIKEVKENLEGKVCLLGNIDCMHLLPFGTEQEVVAAVKDTIRKAAPGGGYILSSSNSIHPGCKGENVVVMFEAAKKYGVYPISVE